MPLTSRQVQLDRYPHAEITPSHFRVAEVREREPSAGEVLVRNTWTSVDPGLRLRLREREPAGYFPAFELGRALDGIVTVGQVIESRAPGFEAGDTVWHPLGWRDYAVVKADERGLRGLARLTRLDTRLAPPRCYLGPLGGMGLTAYAGLLEVASLRAGDIVWVSAAAGAVGSLASQVGSCGVSGRARRREWRLRPGRACSPSSLPWFGGGIRACWREPKHRRARLCRAVRGVGERRHARARLCGGGSYRSWSSAGGPQNVSGGAGMQR